MYYVWRCLCSCVHVYGYAYLYFEVCIYAVVVLPQYDHGETAAMPVRIYVLIKMRHDQLCRECATNVLNLLVVFLNMCDKMTRPRLAWRG